MTIKYTPDHEWLQIEADGTATVGCSPAASPPSPRQPRLDALHRRGYF